MNCISKCTGIVRSFHKIGVNDYLQYDCAECGTSFTKLAIFNNLKVQYGLNWDEEWEKLKILKREIRSFRTKMQRKRLPLAEMVYLTSPFKMPDEHERCDEALPKELVEDKDTQNLLKDTTGSPVYIYTGCPSHKIRWNR